MRPLALVCLLASACSMRTAVDREGTVAVPGGPFWTGSDLDERAHAMDRIGHAPLAEAEAGLLRLHDEPKSRKVAVESFRIMRLPVTNADYHRFVLATGAPEPWVDRTRWKAIDAGFDYRTVDRHAWSKGAPTKERASHPVVLVDHIHAEAYCAWWGEQLDGRGELPSEMQWEKAARGEDGRAYPWGDAFHTARANTLESARGDTMPAGAHPRARSPYGAEDMAGNVFEWTGTPAREGGFVVKGGSWSSDASSARAAARHARPSGLRHVAIGFRCVLSPSKHAK
jgi:formylglycine-generating enzyme required for sulfatase activity